MNYEKKRKRQNGRQEDSPEWLEKRYGIIIDSWEKDSKRIRKLIDSGVISPVTFELIAQDTLCTQTSFQSDGKHATD